MEEVKRSFDGVKFVGGLFLFVEIRDEWRMCVNWVYRFKGAQGEQVTVEGVRDDVSARLVEKLQTQ